MKQHFWSYNEPKTDDDLNNLCINLNADSLFQYWSSRSCSDLNFFVCERIASDFGEKNWLTQCKCPPTFTGKYCETSISSSNSNINETQKFKEESETISCENDAFIFSCPNGGVILVDYALYGFSKTLSKSEQCSKGNGLIESKKDLTCIDSSSLQTMIQKCQGLTYCQFPSMKDLFTQRPCPRDFPVSLNTRLRCSAESNIPNKCPNGALYIQGRCYKPILEPIINSRKTYDEAQAECGINGGNLANPQREPIFSMLYSEIEKIAEKLNISILNEKFWVRNESDSLPTTSAWKNMCPFLKVDTNVPSPGACQSRLHWICEYPPSGEATQRITESLTTSTSASTSTFSTTPTTSLKTTVKRLVNKNKIFF
uniref:SUEL-type lectin domain-containing protein n=1 Tax=Panagrolaimus sp. PS1159 TaxID=55785 RepID=A0AC35G8J2_9BILA